MTERAQLPPALGLVRDRVPPPPPRRPPAVVAGESATATPQRQTPDDEGAVERGRGKKTPRPKASATSTGGLRRTTISVPQRLAESLRERLQADRQVSQLQFILNAIEENADRLKELVEQDRPPTLTSGGLFPDRGTARHSVEPRTTINFDTTDANLKVVDSLVGKSGADSRSHLIRVALRAALTE